MNKLLLVVALICLATAQTVQECPTDGTVLEYVIQDSLVCGIRSLTNGKQIKETFANDCAACNVGKVEYTVSGKCESYPAQAQFCSPTQSNAEICTMIYAPQCGYFNQQVNCLVAPCNIDQYNRCKTCSTKNVLYTNKGKCPVH